MCGKLEKLWTDSGTSRESLIDLVGTTRFDRKTETLYQNDVVFITHLAHSILHTYMMSLSVSPVFLYRVIYLLSGSSTSSLNL